jgi:hypothetical protein
MVSMGGSSQMKAVGYRRMGSSEVLLLFIKPLFHFGARLEDIGP